MARKRPRKPGAKHVTPEAEPPAETFVVYDRKLISDNDDDDLCDQPDPVAALGRFVNRFARAEQAFAQRYLQLHQDSNSEREGGWFWDFEENMYQALRTGGKKLKLWKMVGL